MYSTEAHDFVAPPTGHSSLDSRPLPGKNFLLTQRTSCLLVQVTAGMDIVQKVEGVGSQDGRCAKPVMIADCGQLS